MGGVCSDGCSPSEGSSSCGGVSYMRRVSPLLDPYFLSPRGDLWPSDTLILLSAGLYCQLPRVIWPSSRKSRRRTFMDLGLSQHKCTIRAEAHQGSIPGGIIPPSALLHCSNPRSVLCHHYTKTLQIFGGCFRSEPNKAGHEIHLSLFQELGQWERAVDARRDQEVLSVGGKQEGIDPHSTVAWIKIEGRAIGVVNIHCQPTAMEKIA